MTVAEYLSLRAAVIERGYLHDIEWAQSIRPPATPEDFWCEFAWVVLNSGMKEQIARGIWAKVRPAVEGGCSASTVFGHKGKAAAIDRVWSERVTRFKCFRHLKTDGDRISWLQGLPWIGKITCWHLAKNLGANVAKPDRHLVRIAGAEGTHELCARIARETGERIATVDVVIWRAANLGLA